MFLLFIYLIFNAQKNYTELEDKVIVEKNDTIKSDFSVIGKDLEVKGGILGDLAVINGNVEIEGLIKGDLAVVMGDVKVLKGAIIKGDLAVVGGKLDISKEASVEGEKVNLGLGPLLSPLKLIKLFVKGVYVTEGKKKVELKEEVEKDTIKEKEEEKVEKMEKEEKKFFSEFPKKILIFFSFVIIFGFLVFIVKLAFPGTVENMTKELELNLWKSLGIGLLFQLFYFPFLIFLFVTILGIPLALFILISTPLFLLYGSSSVIISWGRIILQRFKINYKNDFIPIIVAVFYFLIISLISALVLSLEAEGLLYTLLKIFVFSFLFFNFYLVFTIGIGILFVSRLGIKS